MQYELISMLQVPYRNGLSTLAKLVLFTIVLGTSSAGFSEELHPLEAADTSSPAATLASFIDGMRESALQFNRKRVRQQSKSDVARTRRILGCLDLSELPPAVKKSLAKESAVCLKEVLDRIELPPRSEWPDAESLEENPLTKWLIPRTEIAIVLMKEGRREGEYLFSADTVERAVDFYDLVEDLPYVDREDTTPGMYNVFVSIPGALIRREWLPQWSWRRWHGQAIWQWIGLVLVLILGPAIMATIYWIGRRKTSTSSTVGYLLSLAFPISAMLIPLVMQHLVMDQLQIYGPLVLTITFGLHIFFLFAIIIFVISLGNRVAEVIIATPWVQPKGLDAQLSRLTCRIVSIALAVVVVLEGGQQLGIPLTTLLAGVSVSGLAVALAAQDTMKNILGGMMIMLDKPFRVGERIVVQEYDGVVEDIGLRSTRLRLLNGHLVSIPNEELARKSIENIGRRPFIRRAETIELPSGTPAAKVQRALTILRELLDNHEGMADDLPPRIYLRDVNEGSIGIIMLYWFHPPEYWDFLAFSERITLQMAQEFEAEGIQFATPSLALRVPPTGLVPESDDEK